MTGGPTWIESFGDAAMEHSFMQNVEHAGNYSSGSYFRGTPYASLAGAYQAYYKKYILHKPQGLTHYTGSSYMDFSKAFEKTRSPSRLCGPLLRFHSQQVKLPSHRPKSPCRGTQRAYRSMRRLSIPPKRICSPSGTPGILFSRAPLLSASGIRKTPTQQRRCHNL